MLDDEHRVARIAQAPEQAKEAPHVARVEPDRRLVEDVQRVHELRAERVGEADALGLAAGERPRRPIEREIREPDVAQEPHALARLAEDVLGDRRLVRREPEPGDPALRSSTERAATSAIVRPATRTWSAAGWSLAP